MQKFLDPLYGPIAINEAGRALVFSPEFQRLRYVRLCNINSLYLTGASEPKRFEHCIGVYHLADVWANSRSLSGRDAAVVKAAALLHDLMTGPFGHSFQYVLEDNPFEQKFEHANLASGIKSRFHQATRANLHYAGREFVVESLLGDLAGEVFDAIEGRGRFGPIISGTLDLDNLDNVVRLAFHMGLCDDADRALPLRLTPLIDATDGMLGAHAGAAPLLEQWFGIRRRLYELLLLDRGEFAAKAMLTLAVELAAEAKLLHVNDWLLTDDEMLYHLEEHSVGDSQRVGRIVKRLRVGDLFECAGVWRSSATELYAELSKAQAKRLLEQAIEVTLHQTGSSKPRICIHFILDHKKTCRALPYRDLERGEDRVVGYNSKSLLIGVFVTNDRATPLTQHERQRISDAVRNELGRGGLGRLEPVEEPLSASADNSWLFA